MHHSLLATSVQGSGTNWAVIIAAVGTIIAFSALIAEGRRVRRQIAVDNMWRMIDRLDGPAGRAHRSRVARLLLAKFPQSRDDVEFDVVDLLDSFELLGYLVRSKTLYLEAVWTNFPIAI